MSDLSVRLTDHATIVAERAAVAFVTDAGEWNNFLSHAPEPHLPQSFAYGEGKRATGWHVRRATFSLGGRPIAFATVLELHVLGMRVVTRVNRGPVFFDAAPDAGTQISIYSALRRNWRGPLLIAPALQLGERSDAILRAAGFVRRRPQSWRSGRIDLTADESSIRASFSSTFRNRCRGAEKAGAELQIAEDEATYDWLLERHIENMREKGFKGPSPTLLRALRNANPEAVSVFVLKQSAVPVAGMSVVRFGKFAEYHVGWFGPAGRKINAGNFLMLNVILEMKRRGVSKFDLGGLKSGDGYTQFKRTMNPAEYELAGEWMSI
jgi:Acetyltransferase (GNAT) domain